MEDLDKVKKYPNYTPTDDERQKVGYVSKRFSAMQQARASLDQDRDTYQTMIDAVLKPYGDDRSVSTVPLASAMIELFVAEATKIQTEFLFKSETSKHATQKKAFEYTRKYDRRKRNRKEEIIDNEYTTAGFGHSVIFTGFESALRTQYDLDIDDNFKAVRTKREFRDNKILLENIDPRYFFLDNQNTKGIKNANDCMMIQWIGYEEFENYSENELYKNIDKVKPSGYDNTYKPFSTLEESTKQGEFVKLEHYWNINKDMYLVVANGVLIRDQHIMSTIDGRKALPFVIRVFGKKNGTYTGRGLCEALLPFNSELNDLREMLMDGIRRSNNPTIAIGNGLTFNGRKFAFNNEVLTFDGKLSENFQQLSGTPPNQAIFSYLERIYKDIAMFIGIDIQNILGVPQQTAYQTNVQQEASQKRVNVWLTNRDLAFERLANLHKDNLQKFFPMKDAEGIYPSIEIEDEELKDVPENIQGQMVNVKKFVPNKGMKAVFEVTPDILRGDIYIDVFTNTNRPTSNIAERQARMEFLTSIPAQAEGLQILEQMGVPVNTKQVFKDQMETYNITDVIKTDSQELQAKAGDFVKKLSGMMSSGQQPQAPQEMQNLQQNPPIQATPTPQMGL